MTESANCWRRKQFRDAVDTFNKLYVAFTRAEKEMYVIGVTGRNEKSLQNFSLKKDMNLHQSLTSPQPPFKKKTSLRPFHHTVRKPLIVQAYENVGAQETKRGDFIHRVLSTIEFLNDDPSLQVNAAIARVGSEMPIPDSMDEMNRRFGNV